MVVKPYRVYTLGESAVTIDFGNQMDPVVNQWVVRLGHCMASRPLPGVVETVTAYSSLTVYFLLPILRRQIPDEPLPDLVRNWLATVTVGEGPVPEETQKETVLEIPVCYHISLAPDLPGVAAYCRCSMDAVIQAHISQVYRVYMIGFVPGFPYMGTTVPAIHVPRKARPASRVAAGSVALAGAQTGIYPAAIPGGWQVIGRTPLQLYNPEQEPSAVLRAGMKVRFVPIDLATYYTLTDHEPAHS